MKFSFDIGLRYYKERLHCSSTLDTKTLEETVAIGAEQ